MASFSLLKNRLSSLIVTRVVHRQFRMSANLRAEAKEALEDMKKKNPYFEKYASKIATLQETSPEEFLNRVEAVKTKTDIKKSTARTYSELLNPKEPRKDPGTAEIPHKKLSDIMKIELLSDKTADEIKQIWFEYHKTKDVITATLTTEQYEALMTKGKKHPLFILPLPRSEGYEFIMLQFAANTVHFTPLLAYQVHKENAPECLNMVHYTELKDKGIILMRGEIDTKVLTGKEAQCIANQFQLFYLKNDASKQALLETFTAKPESFKHMDLIKELEQIELK
ncbi:ATPAF1 family protein [Megaselia abdita]